MSIINKITKIILFFMATIFLCSSLHLTGNHLLFKGIVFPFLYAIVYYQRKRISVFFSLICQHLNIKGILFIGFTSRLLWAVFASYPQKSDFEEFHNMAIDILNGLYWFNPLKSTGTSIVTAFIYKIFGIDQLAALMPIVIISTIQIWLVYELAKMAFNKNTALLSALCICLLPDHLFYVNLLASDIYFSFFVTLSLFFFMQNYKTPLLNIVFSGICVGISQYFRETSVLVLLTIMILLFFFQSNNSVVKRNKDILVLSFIFLIMTLPIAKYNYQKFSELSISTTQNSGWSMFVGNNPKYGGHLNYDDDWLRTKMYEAKSLDESKRYNSLGKQMAFERIKNNPFQFLINAIVFKPYTLWSSSSLEVYSWHGISSEKLQNLAHKIAITIHRILLFMVSVVLFKYVSKSPIDNNNILIFFLLFASITTGVHAFLEVRPRYHHMFIPLFAIIFGKWVDYKNSK